MGPRVAVIGGGFSGTLVARHLQRLSPTAKVIIYEQSAEQLARGNAYNPASPYHLLNVPTESMGALSGDAGEFLRWNLAKGHAAPANSFVSRQWFGEYLSELLAQTRQDGGGRVDAVIDEVASVRRLEDGSLELKSSAGREQVVDHVVLATGTNPRLMQFDGLDGPHGHRALTCPWRESVFQRTASTDSVAIIGSGLSAVDILAEGAKLNFRGSFVVISSHGLFPCSHAENLAPVPALPVSPDWTTVLGALRAIRALAKQHAEWQHAVDAVRPHLNKVWAHFSTAEKNRFFRHAAFVWDRHRHRMPRSTAEAVLEFRRSGRLQTIAGRVSGVSLDAAGAHIDLTPRGSLKAQRVSVDVVVNCAGFSLDVQQTSSALNATLLKSNLGFPGEFKLGWRCDLEGGLCTPKGARIPGIWAMGSLRKATEFECTAVRELRLQAERLAKIILERAVET